MDVAGGGSDSEESQPIVIGMRLPLLTLLMMSEHCWLLCKRAGLFVIENCVSEHEKRAQEEK